MTNNFNTNDLRLLSGLILLIDIVNRVAADSQYCRDTGTQCEYPAVCCPGGCCHDTDNTHHHAYSYRVSFYNLWYFWFIILFVLMSCFGGCGYYKQRQRFARSRSIFGVTVSSSSQLRHSTSPSGGTMRGRVTTANPTLILPASHSNFGYTGSGDVQSGITLQPPAYSEVMMQPDLYPAHKALGLPPYPGTEQSQYISPDNSGIQGSALPQPPPYSLLVSSNQEPAEQPIQAPTSNQNADNNSSPQSVSANQNIQ